MDQNPRVLAHIKTAGIAGCWSVHSAGSTDVDSSWLWIVNDPLSRHRLFSGWFDTLKNEGNITNHCEETASIFESDLYISLLGGFCSLSLLTKKWIRWVIRDECQLCGSANFRVRHVPYFCGFNMLQKWLQPSGRLHHHRKQQEAEHLYSDFCPRRMG